MSAQRCRVVFGPRLWLQTKPAARRLTLPGRPAPSGRLEWPMSLWSELKRRNVYRVGAAYALVAWVVVQVASVFVPALNLPSSVVSFLAFVVLLGLPVALVLAWLYELTPEGIKRTDEAPQDPALAEIKTRRLDYVIIGAVAATVVLIVVDRFALRDAARGAVSETAAQAHTPRVTAASNVARQPLPNSVAVLPFTNLSEDANDASFAAGIHSEVLAQLARIESLNVTGRGSVMRYANGDTAPADIARELNVQTLLSATVRYADDEVRIVAELLDPATNAMLWSNTYQRPRSNVFAIQSDIATNIATELRAEFSLEERRALERPPTSSPEAYDLYLQALAVAPNGPAGALPLLDRAVSLDQGFAGAYSLRAQLRSAQLSNTVMADAIPAAEREEALRLVREDASKALALDAADQRARAVLADLDVRNGYWSRVPVFENIDFSNYPPSILWVQAWSGNVERALEISERWARLDPNVSFAHMNLGVIYAYAGDRAASTLSMQRALELAPTNTLARAFLAYNAVAVGDTERALAELQRLERLLGENPPVAFLPELAYAYERIGRVGDARRLVARIDALGSERDLGLGARALTYLAVGDAERALEQLELAAIKARNHESDVSGATLMNLRMNFLDDARMTTPRFAEVLARIRGD